MDAAQQEIYNCYRELDELGVLTMQQVDEERTAQRQLTVPGKKLFLIQFTDKNVQQTGKFAD